MSVRSFVSSRLVSSRPNPFSTSRSRFHLLFTSASLLCRATLSPSLSPRRQLLGPSSSSPAASLSSALEKTSLLLCLLRPRCRARSCDPKTRESAAHLRPSIGGYDGPRLRLSLGNLTDSRVGSMHSPSLVPGACDKRAFLSSGSSMLRRTIRHGSQCRAMSNSVRLTDFLLLSWELHADLITCCSAHLLHAALAATLEQVAAARHDRIREDGANVARQASRASRARVKEGTRSSRGARSASERIREPSGDGHATSDDEEDESQLRRDARKARKRSRYSTDDESEAWDAAHDAYEEDDEDVRPRVPVHKQEGEATAAASPSREGSARECYELRGPRKEGFYTQLVSDSSEDEHSYSRRSPAYFCPIRRLLLTTLACSNDSARADVRQERRGRRRRVVLRLR